MFLNLDVHIKMDIRVLFPQSHRSILHRSQIYSIQICEKETEWEWERHCLQSLLCCPDATCVISAGSSDGCGLDSSCKHSHHRQHFSQSFCSQNLGASWASTSWETKNESTISRAGDRLLPHTLSVLHHNLSACKQSTMLTQSLGGNVSLEICSLSQLQKGNES